MTKLLLALLSIVLVSPLDEMLLLKAFGIEAYYSVLTIRLVVLWMVLSALGLDKGTFFLGRGWYSFKHFDKLIHFLSGVALTSFMLDNTLAVSNIFILNFIVAFLWEPLQIATQKMFNLKQIGFPDGYYDIAAHMLGTLAFLNYVGVI